MGKATKILPLITFVFIWFIFSYKFFIKGLIPAPLDFLTNFYSPWRAYQTFPINNPEIPDVVSQIIPWKIYTIQNLKQGRIPLWNPYNFSGTPHLANFQSAVFNIFNFLFLIFSFEKAWSLFILFQPLLAGIFTFLFCRKIGLRNSASFLSSLAFAFSGFLTSWLEYGTLGWAILWLPLTLLLWEYFWETGKSIYWLLINFVLSFSILSGHFQISLYLFLANFLYFLFAFLRKRFNKKIFLFSLTVFISPFLLTAFQLLPTLELYFSSPRGEQIPFDWFKGLQIPVVQLITFFFPDFFGHPVTRNQWGGGSYVEMMGYIGLLPILMVIFYLFKIIQEKKWRKVRNEALFFFGLALLALLLALPTPLSSLIVYLKIPVLASSAPSRIICLISFSLAMLSGFGWELFNQALKKNKRQVLKFLLIIFILFISLLLATYFLNKVTFRNLIFPLAIFTAFFFGTLAISKFNFPVRRVIYSLLFIILVAADLFRFWYKFTPFNKKESFYPSVYIINFLKQNTGQFRIFGLLDDNLNLPFKVYTTSGYDSLPIADYQKLLRAAESGPVALPARTTGEAIAKRGKYSKRLLDKLGVKYVVVGKSDVFAFSTWEYPKSFELVWEDKQFYVYENKKAWPRFLLTRNHKLVSEKDFLWETLKVDEKQIVLIDDPNFIAEKVEGQIELEEYQLDKILLRTFSEKEAILFLSDVYYPGWQAYIDGKPTLVLKANYAFRAVKVPQGEHQVEFIYSGKIFKTGVLVSSFTLLAIISFLIFDKLRAKRHPEGEGTSDVPKPEGSPTRSKSRRRFFATLRMTTTF